jgi:hypothetical protein
MIWQSVQLLVMQVGRYDAMTQSYDVLWQITVPVGNSSAAFLTCAPDGSTLRSIAIYNLSPLVYLSTLQAVLASAWTLQASS